MKHRFGGERKFSIKFSYLFVHQLFHLLLERIKKLQVIFSSRVIVQTMHKLMGNYQKVIQKVV